MPCVTVLMLFEYILTDEKVLRPEAYIALRDGHEIPKPSEQYTWYGRTIQNIIFRPEYHGVTVNFRTYKDSYKDKRPKQRPPEEWLVFENTQEPIIDKVTWETAQKSCVVKRRPNNSGTPNPITGLAYCGDCGRRMYNARKAKVLKYDSHDSYACSGHSTYPPKCTMHYIKTSSLQSLLLDTIRSVSHFVQEDEAEFVRLVREASELKNDQMAKVQRKQLAQHQKRISELDNIIKKLYEEKITGGLTAKRFEILVADYEQEQEDLEYQIDQLQEALEQFSDDTGKADKFISIVRKYTDITELTGTILNEFIDKVHIFEADKSSGRREQRVDIHLNFIGQFVLPTDPNAVEPEPFDPVENRRAQWREHYHRNKETINAKQNERRAKQKADKLAAQPVKTAEELAQEEADRKEKKRAYQRKYQRESQRKKREAAKAQTNQPPTLAV